MCLTSIPAQFQEFDDFNFDYDVDCLEGMELGNDDAMFNDFLAGFMPNNPIESTVSEFNGGNTYAMMPVDESSFHNMMPNMVAPVINTAIPKLNNKRSAAVMQMLPAGIASVNTAVAAPVSANALNSMLAHNNDKGRRLKKRRRRAFSSDDPRRSFVDMIFGAINSGDPLLPILQRIALPEVVMTVRFLGDPSTLTVGKLFREIRGREQIAQYVDTMMLVSPDLIMRLHEKKMRLRQNNSSYTVAKYTLEGHQFCHLLTTNDKSSSKKALCPLKTVPATAKTVQAVSNAVMSESGKLASLHQVDGSTSHDDTDESAGSSPVMFCSTVSSSLSHYSESPAHSPIDHDDEDDEDWNDQFFDELSVNGSPIDLEHSSNIDQSCFAADDDDSLDEEIHALQHEEADNKSKYLLNAWQFAQRPQIISGEEKKISVATSNTEFGVSHSFNTPTFVSTIGTMALHINPNRQVYKIDFLWTYNSNKSKADSAKAHK